MEDTKEYILSVENKHGKDMVPVVLNIKGENDVFVCCLMESQESQLKVLANKQKNWKYTKSKRKHSDSIDKHQHTAMSMNANVLSVKNIN